MKTHRSLPAFLGLLGILVFSQARAEFPLVSSTSVSGASTGSQAYRLAQNPASGDLYAAGVRSGGAGNLDIWLARYSPALVQLSSYTYDKAGFDDAAFGVAVDTATGNVFAAGYVSTGPALSSHDIWLARFSSSLVLQSSITINGSANDRDEAVSLRVSSGVVYVVGLSSQTGGKGYWLANFDTNFVLLSSGSYYQNNCEVSDFLPTAGGTYVVGSRAPNFLVSNDAWIGKFDANHVFLASSAYNGPSSQTDHLFSLAEDGSGGVFAVGYVYSGTMGDQYIAHFDSSLARLSSTTVNGPGNNNDALSGILLTSSGTLLVAGSYSAVAGLGGINLYLAEYDASFNKLSSTSYTSPGNATDWAAAVLIGANQDVYAGGYAANGGSQDIWLGRFSTSAVLPSVPAGLASSFVGVGAATISWTANGNASGSVYQLERSTGSAFGLRQSGTGLSFVDAALSPASTYYYRVRALNADLVASAYASSIAVVTSPVPVYPAPASIAPSTAASGTSLSAAVLGTGFDASAALSLERMTGSPAWVATGSFAQARELPTLTKLRDGRAMLVGGLVEGTTAGRPEVDFFSLSSGVWTAGAPMNQGRFQHAALMLADGRVLVTGGQAPDGTVSATAEIFDPAAGAWTNVAPMGQVRKGHRTALLQDGRVLALGGYDGTVALASTEIYDPALNTWTPKAPMSDMRFFPIMAVLADGKVLVAGGRDPTTKLATSQLYDPALNSWTATGPLSVGRSEHWSLTLPDGRVLAAGGLDPAGETNTADVFDPATSSWTATGPMSAARRDPALVLYNGRPLIVGGDNGTTDLATTEFYDAATNSWSAGPSLTGTRNQTAAAVILDDGGALIAGGRRGLGGGTTLNTAERLPGPAASIAATGVSVPDAQHASGTFDLTGAATGYWDVVIREFGGRTGRLSGGVRVSTALAAPSGFAGVALSSTSILWSWADNSTDETGFRVKSGGSNVSGDLPAGTTLWLQTGLTANATSGSLLAQAFNASGTADSSPAVRYALTDPPDSITATFFGSSVALTWPVMTNPAGTLWSVERSTDAGVSYGQLYYSSAAAAFTDAGLAAATTYYYRVRSANGDGEYSFHANASASVYTGGGLLKTWVGLGLTANSSEAANWSPAFAPAAGDSFVFSGASTKTCHWDSTATINSLTLAAGFDGFAAVYMRSSVSIASVHASTGFLALASQGSTVTVTGDVVFDGQAIPMWDRGVVRLGGGLRVDGSIPANYTISAATTTLQFYGAGFHPVTGTGNIQLPFIDIVGSSDVYIGASVDAVAQGLFLSSGRLVMGTNRRFGMKDWTQTGGQFVAGASTVAFYTLGTSNFSTSYIQPLAGNPFRDVEIGYGTNRPTLLKALGPLDVSNTVTITTGAFDGGGFAHVVGGDWQELGGPTVASGGSVRFTAGRPAFLRLNQATGFPALTIELACATCSLTAQANATIAGTLTVTTGAWQPGAFSHRLRGDVVSPLGRMLAGTGLTTLDGGAAQALSSGSNNFYDLVIANAAGVSIAGASAGLNIQRHLDVRAGARLDITSDSIAVGGALISSGTIAAAGSTITLNGAAPQAIQANGAAFGNLTVVNASTTTFLSSFTAAGLSFSQGGGALVFAAGSTFTVSSLDLGASLPATRLRLRSSAAGTAWRLDVLGSATALATDVQDSDASAGAAVAAVSTSNLDGGGNVHWIFGLAAPTAFAGAAQSTGAILWTWTDNSISEDGFRVMAGATNVSGDLPANATSWLQTGLSVNASSGSMVVRAFDALNTADSGAAARYSLAAPPSSLAASGVSRTSATISWISGNPAGTVFELERSTGTGFGLRQSSAAVAYQDTGLAAGASYSYRARARNGDGLASAYTSSVTITAAPYPTLVSISVTPSAATVAASSSVLFTAVGAFNDGSTRALNGSWAPRGAMNEARTDSVGAFSGGKLYLFSGAIPATSGTFSSESYDPAADSWTYRTASPVRRSSAFAAEYAGKIYVAGGCVDSNCTSPNALVYEYDTALDAWTAKASLPSARFEASMQEIGGKLYAAGGLVNGYVSTNTLTMYDPGSNTWTAKAPMPYPRGQAASGVIGGKLYVAGGRIDGGAVTGTELQIYDPVANAWSLGAPMPNGRIGAAGAVVSGRLYAIGGADDQASPSASEAERVQIYDAASDTWSEGPRLLLARWGAVAGAHQGKIYATATAFWNLESAALEVLDPTEAVWSSNAPAIGTVTAAGSALGQAPGAAVITASSGPLNGTASLTVIGLPAAPSGVSGAAQTTGSILWSWSDNATTESGYRVLLGTANASGDLAAGATIWLQTGLTANASASALVQAFNSSGTANSAAASAYALAAIPGAPAFSSVAQTSALVSWSSGGNPAWTAYELERSTGAGYGLQFAGAATFYADASLAAGTTYYFRVRALNGDGAPTAYASTAAVVTVAPAPGAPGTPAGTALGISSISWTWALSPGAASYSLYRPSDGVALGSSAAGPFVQTGLTPNAAYGLRVAAVNAGGESALSAPATAYTLAAAPTGAAAASITSTTLVASWTLGVNPAATLATLERSADAVAYSTLTAAAVTSYADAGLLGCTTYYYRVRNANGDGVATAYASFQAVTANTIPSPPSGLNASSNAGGTIGLSWGFSPTEGVAGYRLYWDAGTGSVSYAAPLAVLASTETSFTTGVLASSAAYTFALRAVHRCGTVETSGALAMAGAAAVLAEVRAAIKEPDSGRRVNGNRVTILGELIAGTPSDVQQIVFQYKPAASSAWLDVDEANLEHPNPDFSFPYFVHVDVTALAPGDYDLRAVAYDLAGVPDPAPPAVRVAVDPITPDVSETQTVDGKIKKDQTVSNTVTSVVDAAGSGAADPAVRVTIPVGAVNSATATVSVISNPAIATAAPSGQSLVGSAIKIDLSNGQSALNGTAEITLTYPDTVLFPSLLQIYYLNEATGQWSRDFNSTVDTASRTVTGRTPHFSTFALLLGTAFASDLSNVRAYPVPFKPNGTDANEGRPFSEGNPNSGIIFSNLAAGSEIRIYTLTGRLVASLDSPSPAGAVRWDARNQDGRDVASGAYFAVISAAGQKNVVKKLVIIR